MNACESFFYDGNTLIECAAFATKEWNGQLLCDFCCSDAFNEAVWEAEWGIYQTTEMVVSDV